MTKECMAYDVLIIGGGPAGLTAAIKLAQLNHAQEKSLSICVIEKSAEIGDQILSGATLEPRALNELLPDWQARMPPMHTKVTEDFFLFLTKRNAWRLPTPSAMQNHGNYILSLGQFCRWLGEIAVSLGIDVFPGCAGVEICYENDRVVGIITGDKGVDVQGKPKANYQPGITLLAKQVIFAEGCRGSLTKTLIQKYQLDATADPQTYGLGIKEIWRVPKSLHQPGYVMHSVGWPLASHTYGGGFLYHWADDLVSLGFVIGLDYSNPYLNPYEEFQKFKTHPHFLPLFENSTRLSYGARTLVEGGLQSLPKLTFPGGLIIGDGAGFLNVAKIKGIHTAMKSALVAAENVFELLKTPHTECKNYFSAIKASWLWQELYRVRNVRPGFRFGLFAGLTLAAMDTYLFRGHTPWTLHHPQSDHATLKNADQVKPIVYPKHDNKITFDLNQSLYLANIHYAEDQPYHLKLTNRLQIPININLKLYASPETRYCPAGVYEIIYRDSTPHLMINGANCLQCKACDIKDPTQNITWTPSEGGSGPQYNMM